MNKKTLIWVIVAAVVVVGAIVWIVVAANSGNKDSSQNSGGNIEQSSQITDTSIQGEVVEGSSIVVTEFKEGAIGGKATMTNAGDTAQNRMIIVTFLDANGNEIATGKTFATLEPGASKESIVTIDGDWEEYDSITYKASE